MGFLYVVAVHLLENREDFLSNRVRQGALQHRLNEFAINMNSGWKPQGNTSKISRDLGCCVLERSTTERLDE